MDEVKKYILIMNEQLKVSIRVMKFVIFILVFFLGTDLFHLIKKKGLWYFQQKTHTMVMAIPTSTLVIQYEGGSEYFMFRVDNK